MSGRVRFVTADDHGAIRLGVRTRLQQEAGWTVVGESADGVAAVELAQRLRPEVLVLDVDLPGLGGIEVTRRVRKQAPSTRVLAYSMLAHDAVVFEVMRAGARGYVLKDGEMDGLVEGARKVLAGGQYLAPPLSWARLHQWVKLNGLGPGDPHATLSRRETQVLGLLGLGKRTAAIAEHLGVGVRAVESVRSSLIMKLELDGEDLARHARRFAVLRAKAAEVQEAVPAF